MTSGRTTQQRATLKDVAKAVGVHVSTVSRALDPKTRHLLTEDVVKRVTKAAADLDYQPNSIAYSLRTNRSRTVGVLVPDITNQIFPPIVRGIEDALAREGNVAIIVNTDSDPAKDAQMINVLRARGVDGLILASAQRHAPEIIKAAREGIPIVTVNRAVDDPAISSIVNDEGKGIELAVEHVVALGHRRIAHIAGPETISTGLKRRDAYFHVAEALELEDWKKLLIYSNGFNEAEGRRCADALFDLGLPFTAIVCANDRLAIGALEAIEARGLSCPDDISLTGFNDMPFVERLKPALTTVRIQTYEAGHRAAEIFLEQIAKPVSERVAEHVVLPVELIIRGSTGPAKG
ncbi:LacI family DNA-binding transcriptional regulator [Breoghania sp. L-A4]|uniref:LacI family DNA-binding transcriptional regulator n=1 Tax=Breoghania sp. L-A4 TaxID=2304600 RepID=UPI000E35EBF9|nr:LacI family DNA-binding transcriptional regulator [Breoghania sp. L-A4]AXS40366.1 LacI family transcriptional regulator [Breoghania sp. L-A4]